jgi:hypothetical protein
VSTSPAFPTSSTARTFDQWWANPPKEGLFPALVEMSKQFPQPYLVFDALGECDRATQRVTLLPMLHRMGKNGFRVFMTSRRYANDIEEIFQV